MIITIGPLDKESGANGFTVTIDNHLDGYHINQGGIFIIFQELIVPALLGMGFAEKSIRDACAKIRREPKGEKECAHDTTYCCH